MWGQVKHVVTQSAKLAEYYDSLPMQPLKVECSLAKHYSPSVDGLIHLDALLASAVMQSLGSEAPVLDKSDPAIFPVPIKIKWVSSKGLPLMLSTGFLSESGGCNDVSYWHKRFPASAVQRHCVQPNTATTKGFFKEYRIPVQVVQASQLTAYCAGNKGEIEKLLNTYITHVGKKRSQGKGLVSEWSVSECNETEQWILDHRLLPNEYTGKKGGRLLGWCPPYWFKSWHDYCQ